MTKSLLLHGRTEKQLLKFLDNPSHALLIHGPDGSGKETLAKHISAQLIGITDDKLRDYPYFTVIEKPDDKQEIPIAAIRQLISELRLKPVISGGGKVKRAIVINNAGDLSEEAQNALLKMVEEPSEETVFILTVRSVTDVLPTIASRSQRLSAIAIGLDAANKYFQPEFSKETIESAWRLSQGAAGLTNALLRDDSSHPLKQAVDKAKQILRMGRYERISLLDGYNGNKNDFLLVIEALNRILTVLHHSEVKKGNAEQAKRLLDSRKLVNSTISEIQVNGSVRLAALNLALRLPI